MTPKEVRQLWVKALRSGEYKQGRTRLRTKDGKYCCLGVLTDLAVKNGVIPEFIGSGGACNLLLDDVRQWAGLDDKYGSYSRSDHACLCQDNDRGKDFSWISDLIESEPDGLCLP